MYTETIHSARYYHQVRTLWLKPEQSRIAGTRSGR